MPPTCKTSTAWSILCWLWAAAICPPLFGQLYQIRNYTSRDGLAHGAVFDVFQDQEGYIWIGTYGGLSRYDGNHFTTVTNNLDRDLGQVRKIFQTRSGDFWFCTSTGAYRLHGDQWDHFSDEMIESNYYLCGVELRSGTIVLGTYGSGIIMLDGDRVQRVTTKQGLANDTVWALLEDSEGALWVGTRGGGLSRWAHDEWTTFNQDNGLQDNNIFTLAESPDGKVYIGTGESGISVYSSQGLQPYRHNQALASQNVSTIVFGSDGEMWIGTFGGGILALSDPPFFQAGEVNGLASDYVTALMQDYEGNFWVGTYGSGVSKYIGRWFENYTKENGLSSGFVTAVSQDRTGAMWFGTRGGGITKLSDGVLQRFAHQDQLSSNIIRSLLHDSQNRFWIGTNNGLNLVQNDTVRVFTEEDGIYGAYVGSIVEDPSGNIWVVTNYRNGLGVFAYMDGRFQELTCDLDLPSWFVQDMQWDATGKLWMCTNSFLLMYDGESCTKYGTDQGYLEGDATGILIDNDGIVWSSSSKGLTRFDGSKFTTFTTADGLPTNSLFSLLSAPGNELWIGSNRGVIRFDGETFHSYDHNDGLAGDETLWDSSFIDRNGNLWFGTSTGVSKYQRVFERPNLNPPRIKVERVNVNGLDQNLGQHKLHHGQNEIEFSYTALSFTNENEVRYQYRLLGLSEAWSPETTDNVARYERLPPNQYTFQVRAKNNDGIWSQAPAEFRFTIAKPFWRTRAFVFSGALVLLGLVVFLGYRFNKRTQRRHHKLELARFQQRYQALYEHAPDLYCSLDREGNILHCNQAIHWMLGYEKVEIIGKSACNFLHPDDRNQLRTILKQQFDENGRFENVEARAIAKDESVIWLSIHSSLFQDEDKPLGMTHTICRDITSRKRSELSLQQAQRLESLGLLAGGVAHDFNNLLSAIMGNAELATNLSAGEPQINKHLTNIMVSSQRAADLTTQLLAYAGKQPLDPDAVDINQLIKETMQLLQLSVPKGVEMACDLSEGLAPVMADRGQLLQVVMNLITNASEAVSKKTGRIWVKTEAVRDVHELVTDFNNLDLDHPDGWVCLSVEDNGQGIPPSDRRHIFEPFFTTKFAGRGLGLAAVIGIVNSHRGAIQVQSDPGEGTRFRVYFPATHKSCKSSVTANSSHPADRTILIVEDEPLVREMVETVLQHHGYRTISAEDGAQALNTYHAHRQNIDLLLIDITLPVHNGDAVLKQVRATSPDIKAVLTSGYGQNQAMAAFKDSPTTWFIHKPYRHNELLAVIEQALHA